MTQEMISTRNVKIISVEGNIGAGKSTIITNLKNYFNELKNEEKQVDIDKKIIFIKEPLDVWEATKDISSGKNMIELFYENQKKWSFTFQMMVLATQEQLITETIEHNPQCEVIISERSIDAGKHVFTEMSADSNNMSNIEYQVYNLMFNNCKYKLNETIFIDINPETCYDRVCKRARDGESGVDLEYLKCCDDYYRKWLFEKKELCQYPEKVSVINDNQLHDILPVLMPMISHITQ